MKKLLPFFSLHSHFSVIFLTSLIVLCNAAAAASPPLQLSFLLAIKSSLQDPFNSLRDWNLTARPIFPARPLYCSWGGVGCDQRTNEVTTLDLSGRNLSGHIPADIRRLAHLRTLNLSWNSFYGPLPAAIFELPRLTKLDINHNFLNSSFTNGISKLKSLTFFNAFSNSFTGPLPEELVYLKDLEYLNLGGSYFEGVIPSSYGEFPKLKSLYLSGNLLTGRIPGQLGFSTQLEHLELGYNSYDGKVPGQLSRLSNLVYLDISSANLSGNLPDELGRLKKLEILLLFHNSLSGSIPAGWAQMGSLQVLDLSDNNLSGEIPAGFSGLEMLNALSLMNNNLTGEIPEGIGELPYLETLSVWNNSLSGMLPQKLGSNAKLQKLDVSSNSLSGPIPPNLCLSDNLVKLMLFSNKFVGEIPSSLANCTALYRVRIQNNYLNGSIPLGFGSLPNLAYFELSGNRLSGPIPNDLGNAAKLEFLNISENSFDSELPNNIWSAPSLQIFSASSAKINGMIPNFTGCRNFYKVELDRNNLSGSIPWDIGHCMKLITLDLNRNSLTGIIPWEISSLPSITDVDLSHNYLTGAIPSNFNNCTTLENFNVSYNQLTGPIPSSGLVFSSLHPSSFAGNEGLCGGVLEKRCGSGEPTASAMDVRRQPKKTAGAVVWIIAAAFGVGLFILIAGSRCFQAKYSRNRFSGSSREIGPWKLTAFQRLNFTTDDVLESLNMSDKILGMGSTGTVYKAEMPGGDIIAVKQLWGKNKENIMRRSGVLAEVAVLGNVRHRNIVRLLGCCGNNQCTMLLYEYMPNGSLDDLLHGKNKVDNLVADWVTRYKIALGVAQGICYLHHDCDPVIVHRDLKPSNILLDAEMEARVADFGVAKLIQSDESMMSVIAGSYGYIAPEYAYTLQVDEKSDIYSYGVVLMEILTGKRSVDAEFGDGNSIVDWVKSKNKTKSNMSDVLDKNAGASCASVREEMMLLLRVALLCTSRNPADRPSMRDVVSMLHEAKPKRKLVGSGGGIGGDGVVDDLDFQEPIKPTVEC
ncbi:leucine-rich repeat receptor-like protein kinase tdr [Phtheirospermum japonicum]|uniref:non-specific serine/threonine protein kinase n=1 Tax=Phtheirospermum japonicum TaxID=374723 RepID=A0A830D046_9LAMI|nr:leucine-rich repeat receptor-like protein kinase tdr [Phtheirospermum japonicum]